MEKERRTMNSYADKVTQEFAIALASYYRTDGDGDVTDARPEMAMRWACTAQNFPPEEIESPDLAAIMSCCAAVDPQTRAKLVICFDDVDTDDEESLEKAWVKATGLLQLSDLRVRKGHPVHGYVRQLFNSDAGKRLLVDVAICFGMIPRICKAAVCSDPKSLITADTDVSPEPLPDSRRVNPVQTGALMAIPDDPEEAEELFRQALKPGNKGKRALAALTANPTQALALLNQGALDGTVRFQADVLDKVVEGVTQDGTSDEDVKQMLHDHLRPEVLAELLTGRGDLPATAVSYAPLEVVFKAIQEELEQGKDLFRLHYWAVKLVDAGYEHYEEFLRSSVEAVNPSLFRSRWTVADLLIADLLDREIDGRPLLHELTLLRIDSVLEIETIDEYIGKLEADLPELLAAFNSKPEEDNEDEEPDSDMERGDDEADLDEEEGEDEKPARGKTDETANGLDLE